MILRPPRTTLTDPLCPYTTLFRSKLDTFLETIDSKFELGFDFEARSTLLTQRAINAIDAVPPAIGAIRAALPKNTPDNLRVQLDHLQSQITTYGVTPTPPNEPEIRQSIKALDEFAAGSSEERRVGNECVSRCIYGWAA